MYIASQAFLATIGVLAALLLVLVLLVIISLMVYKIEEIGKSKRDDVDDSKR